MRGGTFDPLLGRSRVNFRCNDKSQDAMCVASTILLHPVLLNTVSELELYIPF